jgi:SAM-dependent methyltransferase
MVQVARERLSLFAPDADVELAVAAAEALPFDDASVDVVVGRFILHHLDIERAASECSRVLAPGGKALFVENSGRNPLLMLARDHLAGRFGIPRFGTEDERPLAPEDLHTLADQLPNLRLEYPVFDFFKLFDRQVLRQRWKPASRFLWALDHGIWRHLPRARKWSFRTLVIASI